MKTYIIQSTHNWVDKKGIGHTIISYFKEHRNIVLPMNAMVSTIEEAKKYNNRALAYSDLKKYFRGKTEKVIAV